MSFKEDLEKEVNEIFRKRWETSNGKVIPSDQSLTLGNQGIRIDATVLYADLAGSTKLVQTTKDETAAEIYKSFLKVASKIIKANDGEISAFDGDRVMAIFMGGQPNTDAIKTAMQINYAISYIVKPAFKNQYSREYDFKFGVGVHTSPLLVCKTGVRGSNDLLWMGNASNIAAKLCSIREYNPIWITESVYDKMLDIGKYKNHTTKNENMWTPKYNSDLDLKLYSSNYTWEF